MPYAPNEKDEFKKIIASGLDVPVEKISFQLVEIPTSAMEVIKPQSAETPLPQSSAEARSNYLKNIEDSLSELNFPFGAKFIDYQVTNVPSGLMNLKVFYLSESDLSADAREILSAEAIKNLRLTDSVFEFERITPQAFPIPFQNGGAMLQNDGETILNVIGDILQKHPRLNLIVNISPNDAPNTNLKAGSNTNSNNNSNGNSGADPDIQIQKTDALKDYFKKNWNIEDERLLISEGENNIRLVLNE